MTTELHTFEALPGLAPSAGPGVKGMVQMGGFLLNHHQAATAHLYDPSGMAQTFQMAEAMVRTGLWKVNRDQAFAILQSAKELGIPPTMALDNIVLVNGKRVMQGTLMLALVQRDGHKVSITFDEKTFTARAVLTRRDGTVFESSFSKEDARLANLLSKGPWQQYPRNMVTWRAVSNVCRIGAPDCLGGIGYTPEDFDAVIIDGELIHAEGNQGTQPAPKTLSAPDPAAAKAARDEAFLRMKFAFAVAGKTDADYAAYADKKKDDSTDKVNDFVNCLMGGKFKGKTSEEILSMIPAPEPEAKPEVVEAEIVNDPPADHPVIPGLRISTAERINDQLFENWNSIRDIANAIGKGKTDRAWNTYRKGLIDSFLVGIDTDDNSAMAEAILTGQKNLISMYLPASA